MIISKTPLRISFAGGGSDFEDYYKTGYGAVVSTAIDKHIYVVLNKRFGNSIRLLYTDLEDVQKVSEIRHNLVRESIKLAAAAENLSGGVSIQYSSELLMVHEGSGLGASSALAVGLLNALYAYLNKRSSSKKLAIDACRVEIDMLGHPIGKQDQYAVAFGGFNYIKFKKSGGVEVRPIQCSKRILGELNSRLLMFYTGLESSSQKILTEQKSKVPLNLKTIDKMVLLAEKLKMALERGNLDNFGSILHENWVYKKSLASGVSNTMIDKYYNLAMKAGASGGKILGSGGGGFLLFYCPLVKQSHVRRALHDLREIKFGFETEGSKIIQI